MSYDTASTLLENTSHTLMYHDTTIVLEHSFRYRKSIYYSLVTPSKFSYLYIDFAQYANGLEYVLHVGFTFYCLLRFFMIILKAREKNWSHSNCSSVLLASLFHFCLFLLWTCDIMIQTHYNYIIIIWVSGCDIDVKCDIYVKQTEFCFSVDCCVNVFMYIDICFNL